MGRVTSTVDCPAVEFSVSYRALSDSAVISCADDAVAEALGAPIDVEQHLIDHDTTVESAEVSGSHGMQRLFLAAQVLGVAARSRHGLFDNVMPARLQHTLMSLVHSPNQQTDHAFAPRRTTTNVPLSELTAMWSNLHDHRRPRYEVKAVRAALDDLATAIAPRPATSADAQVRDDVSNSLRALGDDVAEGDGLPVPLAAARTAQVLGAVSDSLDPAIAPVVEAVFDLSSASNWEDTARILREVRTNVLRSRQCD
ncbi:MAG: hypothetical protein RLZZ128_1214 [Actinomycetota bacterium]